jgi:hypothetical protein
MSSSTGVDVMREGASSSDPATAQACTPPSCHAGLEEQDAADGGKADLFRSS